MKDKESRAISDLRREPALTEQRCDKYRASVSVPLLVKGIFRPAAASFESTTSIGRNYTVNVMKQGCQAKGNRYIGMQFLHPSKNVQRVGQFALYALHDI